MPITDSTLQGICSKKQLRGLPLSEAVKKLTHLNLEDSGIKKIENLEQCVNVSTLYLFDNELEKIENLAFARQLTHLYLQKNRIRVMEGLETLRKLSKLHLNGNAIACVEGLDGCPRLEELHLSRQRPAAAPAPEPELVELEPLDAAQPPAALSQWVSEALPAEEEEGSLRVLEMDSCGITTVAHLRYLGRLEQVNLANNALETLTGSGVDELLPELKCLQQLDLRGNGLCRVPKYRDEVILLSESLGLLDDKEILQKQRLFLHQMRARRGKTKPRKA